MAVVVPAAVLAGAPRTKWCAVSIAKQAHLLRSLEQTTLCRQSYSCALITQRHSHGVLLRHWNQAQQDPVGACGPFRCHLPMPPHRHCRQEPEVQRSAERPRHQDPACASARGSRRGTGTEEPPGSRTAHCGACSVAAPVWPALLHSWTAAGFRLPDARGRSDQTALPVATHRRHGAASHAEDFLADCDKNNPSDECKRVFKECGTYFNCLLAFTAFAIATSIPLYVMCCCTAPPVRACADPRMCCRNVPRRIARWRAHLFSYPSNHGWLGLQPTEVACP